MRSLITIFLAIGASIFSSPAQNVSGVAPFEFHSGFWVNLHHFLYQQAMTESAAGLDSNEWRRAVDYYKREVVKQDLLSREMEAVNNELSSLEAAPSIRHSDLQPEWIAVLEGAATVYRERWWAGHDRTNQVWIAAAQPIVEKYAGVLTKELAAAYGTSWPTKPIRTDVAVYANWSGAYTTLVPTHVTISSAHPANAAPASLEILFHEASHALIGPLRDALSREAQTQGVLLRRRDFWHALLFYTTGEIVSRHQDGYEPYAVKNGLYERSWPDAIRILDKEWQPYLDGKIDMAAAVQRLVADYGTPKTR